MTTAEYSITPTLQLPRPAGRDRQDRSRAEKALGGRRRREDAGVVDQPRGLQRGARFAARRTRKIISEITEDHACRAIVIGANPGAKENRVEAWINVHCHVSRAGSKQVCSEQLSFLLEGPSAQPAAEHRLFPARFRSAACISGGRANSPTRWTRSSGPGSIASSTTARAGAISARRCERVETAQAEAKQRIVLCDLNWTRLVQIRLALAQFFDHPRLACALRRNRKRGDRFRAGLSFDGVAADGLAGRATALGRSRKRAKDDALEFPRSSRARRSRFRCRKKRANRSAAARFVADRPGVQGGACGRASICSMWRSGNEAAACQPGRTTWCG